MTSLHPDIFGHEGGMPQRRLSGNVRGLDDGVIHPPAEPNFWTRVIAKAREWTGQTVETDTLRSAEEPTTASGHYRVAVVLVEFDGTAFGVPASELVRRYQALFFGTSGNSVSSYYSKVSQRKVSITGEVFGPYKMQHTVAHYANGESGKGGVEPNAATLAEDAAKKAVEDGKRFASFDRNGPGSRADGFVDGFVIIHAGPAAELILDPIKRSQNIESHKWTLNNKRPLVVDGGKKIFAYAMVAKDSPLGVICHELGHLLFQLPDLYGKDSSHPGGVGKWCLMGTGNWNGPNSKDDGTRPAHLSAWCKYRLGWVSDINIENEREINLKEVKDSGEVLRVWLNGQQGAEYFLIETRLASANSFDDALPGPGLLIWHIDENQPSNDDAGHPKVCLKQADKRTDLQQPGLSKDHLGDPGDPFTAAGQFFSFGSVPSSRSYTGSPSGVRVDVLTGVAQTIKLHLKVDDVPVG